MTKLILIPPVPLLFNLLHRDIGHEHEKEAEMIAKGKDKGGLNENLEDEDRLIN
jgi:hypothetical protein